MNIKDLGIDVKNIEHEAAEILADRLYEEMNRDFKTDIKKQFSDKIKTAIDDIIQEQAKQALDQTFSPINEWGEPVGKPTTVRDLFLDSCKTWWATKVDSQGRPTTSNYNAKTRAEYLTSQMLSEFLSGTVRHEFYELMKQQKKALHEGMAKAMSELITRSLK